MGEKEGIIEENLLRLDDNKDFYLHKLIGFQLRIWIEGNQNHV